jgi:hypothetical protein
MKHTIIAIAILLAGTVEARAQGTVKITAANTGTNSGEISVSGTWTVDSGWTRTSLAINVWPRGGGQPQIFVATVNGDGTWTATATGLTSNATYNVGATMGTSMGAQSATLQSNYKTATAK